MVSGTSVLRLSYVPGAAVTQHCTWGGLEQQVHSFTALEAEFKHQWKAGAMHLLKGQSFLPLPDPRDPGCPRVSQL
jgi:hypothetical protein